LFWNKFAPALQGKAWIIPDKVQVQISNEKPRPLVTAGVG
jgi:hypothetical protein